MAHLDTIIKDLPSYIDYNWLSHQLAGYASPRVKINSLLKKGEIIRIKKGIYIPGLKYKRDISRGVLSNLIYGPSYVSFEYALFWYGLIPERVYSVTSACAKRKKLFKTPIGEFVYVPIPKRVYSESIELMTESGTQFLIATPEKALADTLAKSKKIGSMRKLEDYLYQNKRLEFDEILKLNIKRMKSIERLYQNKNVSLFFDYLNLRINHE